MSLYLHVKSNTWVILLVFATKMVEAVNDIRIKFYIPVYGYYNFRYNYG